MRFSNRKSAGHLLARHLLHYRNEAPLVLALPRGGVVVGVEIARRLDAHLDVLVVCRLGAPEFPELTIGAVTEEGVRVLDHLAIRLLAVTPAQLDRTSAEAEAELARRLDLFRGTRPLPQIRDRVVLLVDDGLASGVTVRAALQLLRGHQPRRLVLAAPVGPLATVTALRHQVDDLICPVSPSDFTYVGAYYGDFAQLRDEEVIGLLAGASD